MKRDDIISYHEMRGREGMSLQRGMNYRTAGGHAVVLSSFRPGAPYDDRFEADGTVLIYEGHDEPKTRHCPVPKAVDQPLQSRLGRLTQNGLFHEAAQGYKAGRRSPLAVRVYEKIKSGIWVYNGVFELEDSWLETSQGRRVFKFQLRLVSGEHDNDVLPNSDSNHDQSRVIPAAVKVAVWKRDQGKCVECGSAVNLHFDHVVPYSKGGTSNSEKNIQLLCMNHNLQKHAKIQ